MLQVQVIRDETELEAVSPGARLGARQNLARSSARHSPTAGVIELLPRV